MIRAHAWRQILVASRRTAVWCALALQVLLLAAYLGVWGDGVPVVGARDALDQFAAAHLALLVVLVPWIVARGHALLGREDLARRAALHGQRPAVVALGTAVGAAVLGLVTAALALPFFVVAQQVSARPVLDLLTLMMRACLCSTAVALVTSASVTALGSSLLGWIAGCVAAASLTWLMPEGAGGTVVAVLVTATGAAMLWKVADARWLRLLERTA